MKFLNRFHNFLHNLGEKTHKLMDFACSITDVPFQEKGDLLAYVADVQKETSKINNFYEFTEEFVGMLNYKDLILESRLVCRLIGNFYGEISFARKIYFSAGN